MLDSHGYNRFNLPERGKEMKISVVLIIVCAFLFFSTGIARSQDVSDLKRQLEQLQQKIEALEKKQEEQAKEAETVSESVEEIKQQPSAYEVVSEALGKQTVVGGHLKFFWRIKAGAMLPLPPSMMTANTTPFQPASVTCGFFSTNSSMTGYRLRWRPNCMLRRRQRQSWGPRSPVRAARMWMLKSIGPI
jgi:hypothetical protein